MGFLTEQATALELFQDPPPIVLLAQHLGAAIFKTTGVGGVDNGCGERQVKSTEEFTKWVIVAWKGS
eukprot:5855801-Pyramimonas_sp.AAC.1